MNRKTITDPSSRYVWFMCGWPLMKAAGGTLRDNLVLLEYDGGPIGDATFMGRPPPKTVDNLMHFILTAISPKEASKVSTLLHIPLHML